MEVKKESTEYNIIKATLFLLDKNSINNTTTKKIAEKAGVSEVTIFRKFKNKNELINIAKKYCYKNFINKIEKILEYDSNTTLKEYLYNIWIECVELSDKNLNMIKITVDEIRENQIEDKVLPKFSNVIINKLTEFFNYLIKKGEIRKINPNVAALTIFSTIFEAIVLWKIYGIEPKKNINIYLNDFFDIFINGITIGD